MFSLDGLSGCLVAIVAVEHTQAVVLTTQSIQTVVQNGALSTTRSVEEVKVSAEADGTLWHY